ncbi:segregation protein B [Candidatus Methylomirabilis lanthanidiphila]|uniref:Selenide, water dikinase n=1 Tax=Candidatus Methylomirabilis lanthanidiphila TaxID=2211376 RepID=A0A564ZK57_9BACT|nr:segregation protein B [Candidatus Methylomirabilis lanthanidiphila]
MLGQLPQFNDPRILVGAETADDAAVYRLDSGQAIVQTVDYITPVVDDPYSCGQIAAANSLSDIYAMGATPLFALNIVGFPTGSLPLSILGEILRGGADKVREAGAPIIGGHSIDDPEPKYGLVVTGLIDPTKIFKNSTARIGDDLVLTKPLGIGIITTAIKRGKATQPTIDTAVALMATLNKGASEAMVAVGAHACTDVTGFGLLGHLREMTAGSKTGARISLSKVPVLSEAWDLVQEGICPGGTKRNYESLQGAIVWNPEIRNESQLILCDAQTSGGLLIAVPKDRTTALMQRLRERETPAAALIGEIIEDPDGRIWVEP